MNQMIEIFNCLSNNRPVIMNNDFVILEITKEEYDYIQQIKNSINYELI